MFVIVSGPSTVGKSTVVSAVIARTPKAMRLVTATTRKPRDGEVDGKDYFFVSHEEFDALRENGELLEWSEHFGNYYGTIRKNCEEQCARHPVVFGVLDINGARAARQALPETTVTVFIEPENEADLVKRMRARSHGEDEQEERIARARLELAAAHEYDHRIRNADGKLHEAVDALSRIIAPYL